MNMTDMIMARKTTGKGKYFGPGGFELRSESPCGFLKTTKCERSMKHWQRTHDRICEVCKRNGPETEVLVALPGYEIKSTSAAFVKPLRMRLER